MVFAEDEAEFYTLLHKMQQEVNGLGYETILAFDMENAKARDASHRAHVEEYKNGSE